MRYKVYAIVILAAVAVGQEQPVSNALADIRIGNLHIKPGGFLDLIGEQRSAETHDTVSTRFASIPLQASGDELLWSAAHSRVQVHADYPLGGGTLVAYLEADFLEPQGRAPWRWRQYFAEYRRGRWSILGGQGWSLLRTNRIGSSSERDLMHTLVIEPAYHIGIVGLRQREVRITREISERTDVAFEWETGGRYLARAVHDWSRVHAEATVMAGTRGRRALGLGQNFKVRGMRVVGQQFITRGDGAEALGILPGRVRGVAILEGIEPAFRHGWSAFAYGGGVWGHRAEVPSNRYARQWTAGVRKLVHRDAYGDLLFAAQFSQLDRAVWEGRQGNFSYWMWSLRYFFRPAP